MSDVVFVRRPAMLHCATLFLLYFFSGRDKGFKNDDKHPPQNVIVVAVI